MKDLNTFNNGELVYIVTHSLQGLTCVEPAIIAGRRDDHYACDLTGIDGIGRTKYRRAVGVFATRDEAQAELDYLTNYLAMRMSSHHKVK